MFTNKDNLPPTRRACGQCGRLGHLQTTCVAPVKAHLKVGIEIEGMWRDLESAKRAAANWHMTNCSDGSISVDEDGVSSCEFQTRPGSLGEAITQLVAVYPDAVNASCGLHVHVSFNHGDVTLLASDAFHTYFLQRWTAWGHATGVKGEFWKRLEGGNTYCGRGSAFRRSNDATNHDRYRQLNFSAYREHKTVECRLLPMFRDARFAVLAVENLISIYEDFLSNGHAEAEIITKLDKRVSLAVAAEATTPIPEMVCVMDLPDVQPTSEVASEIELYPEPAEGTQFLPYIALTGTYGGPLIRTAVEQAADRQMAAGEVL